MTTTSLAELIECGGNHPVLGTHALCQLLENPDPDIAPWLVDRGFNLNVLHGGFPVWSRIILYNRNAVAVFTRLMHHYDTARSRKSSPRIDVCAIVREGGRTALHHAAFKGCLNLCTALVKAGCSPDIYDSSGYTALGEACFNDETETVTCLLALGANPNGTGRRTVPVCEWASSWKTDIDSSTLQELLHAGADINKRDFRNNCAIDYAIRHRSHLALAGLITCGAQLDREQHGRDILFWHYTSMKFRIDKSIGTLAVLFLAGVLISPPACLLPEHNSLGLLLAELDSGVMREVGDDGEGKQMMHRRRVFWSSIKCVIRTLAPRITEICAALQYLRLPTLVLVEILQAYYLTRWPRLRLYDLWNRAACVRHFHEKKSRQQLQ